MAQLKQTLLLKLFNSKERPSFTYESNGEEVQALLDTGASTPVWCMGEKKFRKAYPNAIDINKPCKISGFGKESEYGKVYVIPLFELVGGGTYKISNLQVAVCEHPQIGYDFVLSDTMFSKTDTYIHRLGEKYVEFYYEKEVYNCLVKNKSDSFTISTYTQ